MNLRAMFSDIQMTTVLVILFQILSSTHMHPISSAPQRTELDLLLDPVFQAEQDVQETKKVVTKSVFHTVLRVPEGDGCPQNTQRVKANGPCVPRYESAATSLYTDEFKLDRLKELQRQQAQLGNKKKRPNGHRHRGSTTPKSITTTDVPVELSTLQDLEDGGVVVDFVDMTSTRVPFVEVNPHQPQNNKDPSMIISTRLTAKVEVSPDTGGGLSNETGHSSTGPAVKPAKLEKVDTNVQSGNNVTMIDGISINAATTAIPISDVKAEIETNFSTTVPSPVELIMDVSSPSTLSTIAFDDVTLLDALQNNGEITTTIKSDPEVPAELITTPNESLMSNNDGVKEAEILGMGQLQNVRVIPPSRVTTPESLTENPIIEMSNSTEDPGVSFYNQDEESYPTTSPPVILIDLLQTHSETDQVSGEISTSPEPILIEPLTKVGEEANESFAAAVSSSTSTSSSPLASELVRDQNLLGFNYTEIRSDNLMTDRTTPAMPDMTEDPEIIITSTLPPFFVSNTSVSDNGSQIDSTPPNLLESPGDLLEQRVLAEMDEKVEEKTNPFEVIRTTLPSFELETPATVQYSDVEIQEQSIPTVKSTPEDLEISPVHNSKEEVEPSVSKSSEISIGMPTHNEGELDRIHHRSRTRNRIKNEDFFEGPQEPTQAVLFNEGRSQHELIAKQFQSQGRSFDPSLGMIGSSNRYPQQFVSLDYLRLGDNYRRFRVF